MLPGSSTAIRSNSMEVYQVQVIPTPARSVVFGTSAPLCQTLTAVPFRHGPGMYPAQTLLRTSYLPIPLLQTVQSLIRTMPISIQQFLTPQQPLSTGTTLWSAGGD